MVSVTPWVGTEAEFYDLQVSIEHQCECPLHRNEKGDAACIAPALLSDQRIAGHMVLAHRMIQRWRAGEWSRECPPST